jgi:hypothetical protein
VALLATGVLLAGFLLASFVIAPAVTHGGWEYPDDFWDNYQLAHLITLGDYPYLYFQSSLVPPPALLFALIPVEFVTRHLGMTTGFGFARPHPSAWPVVAPVLVLMSSAALFAADSLADDLGADVRRRLVVGLAGAVAPAAWCGGAIPRTPRPSPSCGTPSATASTAGGPGPHGFWGSGWHSNR